VEDVKNILICKMNGMQARADMEAQRAYFTGIYLKECSKVFVENTTKSWLEVSALTFKQY